MIIKLQYDIWHELSQGELIVKLQIKTLNGVNGDMSVRVINELGLHERMVQVEEHFARVVVGQHGVGLVEEPGHQHLIVLSHLTDLQLFIFGEGHVPQNSTVHADAHLVQRQSSELTHVLQV